MPITPDAEPRRRILDAALDAVVATGPSIVSVRQIAQRAGVSVGTVTYHFPDKQDLLEECLDELYAALDEVWSQVGNDVAEAGPNGALASRFVNDLFDMLRSHRNLIRLRLLLAMDRGHVPHARLRRHLLRYVDQVEGRFDLPRHQITLRFHAVYVMLVRHCAMPMDEWLDLAGTTDPQVATQRIREHLVDSALGILDLREAAASAS